METGGLGIHYFVNPGEFSNHPVIGAEMAKEGVKLGRIVDEPIPKEEVQKPNGSGKSKSKTKKEIKGKAKQRGPALKNFEDTVERIYTSDLYAQCHRGVDKKQRAKEAEFGIFGIGVDWEKVKKIDDEVVPSCEELKRLGLLK
jgi:DnaJ family protein B protein 12